MIIIGAGFHPEFQQIAFVDTENGEWEEKRLQIAARPNGFIASWQHKVPRCRGMEASGQARWFERLVTQLQFELWIGDAAQIQCKSPRKRKTDRQNAELILKLMLKDVFPADLGTELGKPGPAATTMASAPHGASANRIMNQLQAVALNEGLRCKKRLCSAILEP
jgi:transposase